MLTGALRAADNDYNVASPIRPLKPREMFRTIALTGFAALIAASTLALAPPARAQIGNIFSDPAPRPPGAIPRGQPQPPPDDDEEVPELPRGRLLPAPDRPPPGQGVPPPGSVQSQPLAPPPGTTVVPQSTPPGIAVAAAAARRSQRRQRAAGRQSAAGTAARPAPAQGRAAVAGDAAARRRGGHRAAGHKITNKKASFSGLDKITGRIINFDEDIGETVQFGALRVKTDACYTRPATEAANTDAFVEVDEITLQGEVKRIFSGWMYAASPGLHGVEHPIYDIWLTDCKGPDQPPSSTPQPDPPKQPTAAAASGAEASRRRSRRHRVRRCRSRNSSSTAAAAAAAAAAGRAVRRTVRQLSADRSATLADARAMICQRSAPVMAASLGSFAEIGRLARDRLVEQRAVAPPRDLDRAKTAQMLGDILGVEQLEAARDQPRHQMHQRHLRGVAGAMEHALAEEGAPEADAIQPADQIAVLPDLDAVAVAELVQSDIEIADAPVDPGVLAACLRRGAAGDHLP